MSDDARVAPTTVDYEVYTLDTEPLKLRLQALTDQQSTLMSKVWTEHRWPKLTELDWPSATAVGKALTAVESDTAIGGSGPASIETKTRVAEALVALDARTRHLATIAMADYGIEYYGSPLVTEGEVQLMLWVLEHPNPAWLADVEGVELVDTKSFDDRKEDERTLVEATDAADAAVAAVENAEVRVSGENPAPSDWEDPVPEGSISAIEAWAREPLDKREPDKEQYFERAHRAKVAEVRRKGIKQRKSLIRKLDAMLPLGYVPPYLRVPKATATEPAVPTSLSMVRLDDNEALHIIITNAGVRYWHETEET